MNNYIKHIIFSLIFCSSGLLLSQNSKRTILVLDEETAHPLSGIDLTVDFSPGGPFFSSKTDSSGKFTFNYSGAFKLMVYSPTDSFSNFQNTYSAQDVNIEVFLKNTNLSINPVTIIGTIFERSISKNPYNVRVINKDKIARMGAQSLAEVLQNETNIQLGQDQVLGSSAIMQGIGGQDIKILVNGIPLIGRVNGNIDISQIPINNIERIEIIEGPMSVVYGTDALGGVINIITKNPTARKYSGRLNSYIDNLSNYNFDAGFNVRLGKKANLQLNLGRNFFTGRDFDTKTRVYDWKPKTKIFGDAAIFFTSKNATHRFGSSYYQEKLTDRSDAEYNLTSVTGFNSYYHTKRWDNSINSIFKIDNHKKFQWQNAFNLYTRSKNTIKRDLVTGEEKPYRPEDQDTTKYALFNSRGTYAINNPTKKINGLMGYDFTQQSGSGKRIPSTNPGITDIAIYGSLEYTPNSSLEIRPSVRFIYNSRFGNPTFSSLFGDHLKIAPIIPSIQLKYNLSEHIAFRTSYSKGFRAPSITELYFYFVDVNHNVHGNDNLKAETSDNYILSFDYRHNLPGGKGTVFTFSLYNNIIKNKINLALEDARSNLYTYINIGRFRSQGLNINFEYHTRKYSTQLSASFLNVYDLLQKGDSAVDQKYYINGQVSYNLNYKLPKQKMSLSLFTRYTTATNGYTENQERYKVDGYFLMDLTIQKAFKKQPLNINLGCKNIFGVTRVNSSRPISSSPHSTGGYNVNITPGRTFFIQLAYTINPTQ